MATVVSIINLKGGVGKTTLTVALAEFMVMEYELRVLVIDTDPQTNATIALIGEDSWEEQNQQGNTLYQLFKDHLDDTALFNLNESIVRPTSNLMGGLDDLHLLPSSLDFVQIQDRLINIGAISLIKPIDVLFNELNNHLDDYDLVLIDCPPNLGIVTQNALNISDNYLIPVIPDRMSTYGVPQILESVKSFGKKAGHRVEPLGIVISMYRSNVARHNATIQQLEANARVKAGFPRIFDARIPLGAKISDATDYDAPGINTLKQKYGWSGSNSFEAFSALAEEFYDYAGL